MHITPLAQVIFDHEQNEYWSAPSSTTTHQPLLVDAVDFGVDADRLCGPFIGRYGLIYIDHYKKLPTLAFVSNNTRKYYTSNPLYFPPDIRRRLQTLYGDSTDFWWGIMGNGSLSGIDVAVGADTSWYIKSPNIVRLFASTPAGIRVLTAPLSEYDQHRTISYALEQAERNIAECEFRDPCAERPYTLCVQGTDDCSWTRSFTTEAEAMLLLDDLKKYGFSVIDEQMFFTN